MNTNDELSVKDSGTSPVLVVAILITYMIAGFITACICGVAYMILY